MENNILNLKSKVNLKCEICDKCCKNRGDIKLTPINVIEISNYLNISIKDFLKEYTNEVEGNESEIVLKAKGENEVCILNDLETNKCMVQKVKPMQCVVFPLIPVDIDRDLFINSNSCNLKDAKKISVDKWLNGNNKIYKRNKPIYIQWIKLMEEIQPRWQGLEKEKQELIKKVLFEEYKKGNYEKQILLNIKRAREIFYKK